MKRGLIILGVVLLILGAAALIHPEIPYNKKDEVLKLGSISATVEHQDSVQVPTGVAVLVLIAGLGMVVYGSQIKK